VAKAADMFMVQLIRDCTAQAASNHRLGICVSDSHHLSYQIAVNIVSLVIRLKILLQ